MKKITIFICCFHFYLSYSQKTDSIQDKYMENIIVIGNKSPDYQNASKPLSTLEEYMENSGKVNLIRRGNYAWEPTINSMSTERISVTIDGMKIFNACTDKMDPVTSYVEISNLKDLQIYSGMQGGIHSGNNIGGSLNLSLNKTGFRTKKWKNNFSTGYETNGNYFINGADLAYTSPRFYINAGVSHRKSENYKAGGHKEIYFSQFEKFNTYANIGYKLSDSEIMESSFIYDDASNIGYPALTMDVKSARAWIASLSYKKENISQTFTSWETKFYYNSITHKMDDTKRPDVPIHMDMPGWSTTYGFYSALKGKTDKHSFTINWNGYYNQSKAEMTMYPENPEEMTMFMYTWPDIRTYNTGLSFEDIYRINEINYLHLSSHIAFQRDGIQSDFGLQSIRIFYPDTEQYQNRFLFKASAHYSHQWNNWELYAGGGYGERAPSVSEAYGFYLFNSFDNYDYIGNPQLKNEKSLEGSLSLSYKKKHIDLKLETSYFYFFDYILGIPDTSLSAMTIGASGVKVYTPVEYASIFNTRFQIKYSFFNLFEWTNSISYNLGRDNKDNPLPLIAPVMYSSGLLFKKNKFSSELTVKGAGKHNEYSSEYGESKTSDYLIYNLNMGYTFYFNNYKLLFRGGVENIFDKKYSTYSDWNQIPRKGRNYFISIMFNL